jgi:hypothetical protein
MAIVKRHFAGKNVDWRFYMKMLVILFPLILSLIQCRALNTITMSAPQRSHHGDSCLIDASNGVSYSQVDDPQAAADDSSAPTTPIS